MVCIHPLTFTRAGKIGDFRWMITQPQYARTLFLFNDNEEQFFAYMYVKSHPGLSQAGIDESRAYKSGGGNSIIRPYQRTGMAAGIPTGRARRGYTDLSNCSAVIDLAFLHIRQLLASGRYTDVAFSSDGNGSLGAAIFSPSSEVNAYITNCIYSLL